MIAGLLTKSMTILLNTNSRPYFGGLGDVCLMAWMAEAAKGTEHEIQFVAEGGKRLLLECLGQTIGQEDGSSVMPSYCYDMELADNGRKPRWQYACDFLRLKTGIKRPVATIPNELLTWAQLEREKQGNGPFVVMFPQTHWKPREWPQSSWLFLGQQLKANGINPIFMVDRKDERYTSSATLSYWGFSLAHVMAMMTVADVIIGNDSFPAHIAGTLGRKTIALMGPTKDTVFSHIPDVSILRASNQPCTGCHFSAPFSQACDIGCSALYGISVQDVIDRVKELLNKPVLRVLQ